MVYQDTKSTLKKQGLAPSKKMGQNFLVHQHTADRIVDLAGITVHDTVLEVGVGLGALTRPLAHTAQRVIGLEADSGIIRMHRENTEDRLPDNVQLLHQDVLKADFQELYELCGDRLKIIANLPYSISSPFLFKLIDQQQLIDFAVVMLQKEVADRLMAKPGTKEYGKPSVLLATCAEIKLLMRVKPEEFHPRPKVDSVVVRISFQPVPERVAKIGSFDYPLLRKIVNGAFAQRRKTLLNGLSATGLLSKQDMAQCISAAGIDPGIRAERLDLEEFILLSKEIDSQRIRTGKQP